SPNSWAKAVRPRESRPASASHHHAPRALCPAPKTSAPVGVKQRRRQSAFGRVGGSRNVVSDWLNSRAPRPMRSAYRLSASGTSARGVPPRGVSVKTSTSAKATSRGVADRLAPRRSGRGGAGQRRNLVAPAVGIAHDLVAHVAALGDETGVLDV